MQALLKIPQGTFQLRRLPFRKHDVLRAWDAADEYLLHHLAEQSVAEGAHVVILNDGFGALGVALHGLHPTSISDSYLAHRATQVNLGLNGIAEDGVRLLDSLSTPSAPIDCLLIKVPKTLGLLEYQLHVLRPLLRPDARIIAAGMVKNVPESVWKLLERLIGPTRPSRAEKKARLIFVSLDSQIKLPPNPYPVRYRLEHSDWDIVNHANVFSRDSLDIGTRFLLQHLPVDDAYDDIIDLGCGNGVVGMCLAKRMLKATVHFVDESFMAVASARDNFRAAFGDDRLAQFAVGDALEAFADQSADCIVCNPPFHQQHAIGDQIASQMFRQAFRVLRPRGELRVIGNRHLNYHHALKSVFGHWESVAANAKFTIVKSSKRR